MIVKDVLEVHERCHLENMRHLNRYVRDTLLPQLEHELTRERGLWGPINPSHLGILNQNVDLRTTFYLKAMYTLQISGC